MNMIKIGTCSLYKGIMKIRICVEIFLILKDLKLGLIFLTIEFLIFFFNFGVRNNMDVFVIFNNYHTDVGIINWFIAVDFILYIHAIYPFFSLQTKNLET